MVLISLVASHAHVDLETVARLSAGASQVASSVLEAGHPLTGAVVLATCNRYEVYCEAPSEEDIPAARDTVFARISEQSGIPAERVAHAFDTRIGPDAVRHLFAVGAGLDSAVVGEREIAGQVRRALIEAQQNGTASGGLIRLFETASRTAKNVGSRTALGGRGLSIVSVALDLADELAADAGWPARRVVVFGTGSYAGATMALLRERGCTQVSVFSGSGRAEAFVATRGGTALGAESLAAAIAEADVLIGCSGSDNRMGAAEIEQLRRGAQQPLTVIDLALTHDFDPAVGDLDGVELITLESVRLAAPQEQAESVRQATEIVARAARKFNTQVQARSVDSAIVALRRHTMSVLDAELERVRAQHGCTGPAQEVEFALRRMVKQLLHIPTVRARELAANGEQDQYIAGLEALYGITVESPAAPAIAADPADAEPLAAAAVSGAATGLLTVQETSQETGGRCPVDHGALRRAAGAN